MSRVLFRLLALAALVATRALAADLGEGLTYCRVHALADEAKVWQAALAADPALVLDLRHVTGSADDAAELGRRLASRPADRPLFVLVGPDTPAAVAPALAGLHGVTLGIAGAVPPPQVIVAQAAEADQKAYAAYDAGRPAAELVSGKLEKDRYDEAALMKEFRAGNTTAEPPPAPDPTTAKDNPGKAPALVDRVLQRAIHVHRALLALKVRP